MKIFQLTSTGRRLLLVTKVAPLRNFNARAFRKIMEFIPANKGLYEVGCTDFMTPSTFKWNCQTTGESLRLENDVTEKIPGYFMRFFYPTRKESTGKFERAKWIPKRLYADGFVNFIHFPVFLFGRLSHWLMGDARLHALEDAPLMKLENGAESVDNGKYPVVIFSHGLGANRTCYSSFCSDLASKGFFVAAVEHRDHSASATYFINEAKEEELVQFRKLIKGEDEFKLRNTQVTQRAAETSMALNILTMLNDIGNHSNELYNMIDSSFDLKTLEGSLNLDKVAVSGHSFGGCTAVKTLAQDKRFKCGVVLDAWMFPLEKDVYGKVDQPMLFINSETFHWKGNIKKISRIVKRNQESKMLTIKGTGHHSQCDIPSIIPSLILSVFRMSAKMDHDFAIELQRKLMASYFKKCLELTDLNGCDEDGDMSEAIIEGTNLEITDEERESWYYKS